MKKGNICAGNIFVEFKIQRSTHKFIDLDVALEIKDRIKSPLYDIPKFTQRIRIRNAVFVKY